MTDATFGVSGPLAPLAVTYLEALLDGRRHDAVAMIVDAAEDGVSIRDLYADVLAPVQQEIGLRWERDELTIATEHYCTAVTQLAISQLYPYIFATKRNGLSLVATTTAGNLHELGIRMVTDIFELEGWDTYYLGANTPAGAVLAALVENGADLLLLSTMMDEHVASAEALIARVREDERAAGVKILVGGPPFLADQGLATRIGADAAAASVEAGVAQALELVGVRS